MRRRSGPGDTQQPDVDYAHAPTPNPYRLGSQEWYLEERRRDGQPVTTAEDRKRQAEEHSSARHALSDADIDREELPDLASAAKRKRTASDDHPPVWAVCGLLVVCVLWVVLTEVVSHWWTVRGSFSFHMKALARHLDL